MELFVTGLSHRTAPVELRERLAIVPGELEAWVKRVAASAGVREAVVVSTCNRLEIYGAFADHDEAMGAVRALLVETMAAGGPLAGLPPEPWDGLAGRHLFTRVRREAVHHLFRVAASLDSLVIGEPQILGQVKEAYDLAVRVGTAGPVLGAIFPRAFRAARKVRRDTGIALARVSVSSVAVDLARQFWGSFQGRNVLIVGAGKMADLAARVLTREGATLSVINRTRARADELAARLQGTAVDWSALGEALARADIVISSTGAREPVLRQAMVADVARHRRGRPLVLVDIAVPRDVEPGVGKLNGVFLYDIDDLQKNVAENMEDRRSEADRAEALIEEEIARFLSQSRSRSAGPTIAALRARAVGVARGEAEKVLAGLPGADERTRRALLAMADAIVNKLLHAPSVALKKEAAGGDEGSDLVGAAHRLFDLPPLAPVLAGGDSEGDADGGDGDGADEPGRPRARGPARTGKGGAAGPTAAPAIVSVGPPVIGPSGAPAIAPASPVPVPVVVPAAAAPVDSAAGASDAPAAHPRKATRP